MDLRLLILFLPLLSLQIRAEQHTGSILFLDSPNQQFLRSQSSSYDDHLSQISSMSLSDVGAAISVLLGFSPPASLSEDSSSKLNEILSPNPFNRPRAVVMLEINGIEDQLLVDHISKGQVGSVISSKVVMGSEKAEIQLPGKDEVSVMSLDESLGSECAASCIDKELEDLASLLGVSYSSRQSEKPDEEFMLRLLSLVRNIKKAIKKHADFSERIGSPAELIIGSFSGLKVLQEKYGQDGASQQGTEFFLTTLTKLFDALQEAYQGQIVVIYYSNSNPNAEFGSTSNVKLASRPSPRWLEESLNSTTTIQELVLVRRTLAWTTGIILLLSTLLGIYYLLYMPITRDTLLYSNVKLD